MPAGLPIPGVEAREATQNAVSFGFDPARGRLERDLVDVALVLARAATDTGGRPSLDAAIESLGFTREQLTAMDNPA